MLNSGSRRETVGAAAPSIHSLAPVGTLISCLWLL